jgi:hypothetical protein
MIETQVYSILSSSTALKAICGSRIYPLVLPNESPMPAISYSFVGGSSKSTQDTQGNQKYRLEVNCWGKKYLDSVTLRNAVITLLGSYSQDGIFISYLQPIDFYEDDLLEYRCLAEFYVYFNHSN